MEFETRSGQLKNLRTACILVGVYDKKILTDAAQQLDKASKGHLTGILKRGDITGKSGQSALLYDVAGINATRVLLVGLGAKKSIDAGKYQGLIRSVAEKLKSLNARNALLCLLDIDVKGKDAKWKSRQIVELLDHQFYANTAMKSKKPSAPTLNKAMIHVRNKAEQTQVNKANREATAIALGVTAARDLANTPPNICTPTHMARECRKLSNRHQRISFSVLEEKDMKRLGMGAFLSVSQGSSQPGKLIVMHYRGAARTEQPHVIIGKGISFDSGGISLKGGAGMHEMTYDMCGAASIYGTMTAVADLELPINLVAVIAAAENMPSGDASKPGDIVKTMSGLTVEIQNTDAEGRLVLCDALTYIAKFKPKTVIDVATLTGAIIVALGAHPSGLFCNDDNLAEDLQAAADQSADRIWRLPIWDDYQAQLKSALADIRNIGGREAGSITAACFLARFSKEYRWAHLDVAATAFKSAPLGATGRPVPLLTQYLLDRC